MSFQNSIDEGYVRIIPKDIIKSKSLIKSSKQALETIKTMPINENSSKTILRELYTALMQYIEAIGYLKGYKFLSHKSMTYFIKEILNNNILAEKFDRYRKIRNNINYQGQDISKETVKKSLKEIPEIIKKLRIIYS